MSSRLKFLIGGAVVVAVVAGLIALGISQSTSDYLKVAQVKALDPNQTRSSRVTGTIVPDSVNWDIQDLHLTFQITDGTGTLSISYHGPQPDMLVDAVQAEVVGKYDAAAQVFEADQLLMKCPSKYEEQP